MLTDLQQRVARLFLSLAEAQRFAPAAEDVRLAADAFRLALDQEGCATG